MSAFVMRYILSLWGSALRVYYPLEGEEGVLQGREGIKATL